MPSLQPALDPGGEASDPGVRAGGRSQRKTREVGLGQVSERKTPAISVTPERPAAAHASAYSASFYCERRVQTKKRTLKYNPKPHQTRSPLAAWCVLFTQGSERAHTHAACEHPCATQTQALCRGRRPKAAISASRRAPHPGVDPQTGHRRGSLRPPAFPLSIGL